MRTKNLLLASTMMIGLMPAAALANPVVDTAPTAETAAPAPAEEAQPTQDSDGLTEIVVTATKRETNLQKTPIAISVMGNEDIKKRHVQSLLDLGDGGIPTLRVAPFESRQSALTIGMRGIVPLDANQPAREQGVGVYIDGVYLGRQHGLNAGLLDIERIEVLKGPQGTLFGRNTEGGAVNMITKLPTGEFGGRINAGLGNFGSYNAGIHMDLPEFANISIKLDGVIQHQDATVKNPMAGELGWNAYHRKGARIAARWAPSDNFTADIAYDIGQDKNTPMYSQLVNYNPNGYAVGHYVGTVLTGPNNIRCSSSNPCIAPLSPLVQVTDDRMSIADLGLPQRWNVGETQGIMGVLKFKVNPDLELRSITAYRTVDDDQWDNSGGAHRPAVFAPNGNFARYSLSQLKQHQFSQELQAVGSLPQVDYVFGLYYFKERAEDAAATPNTARWNANGTGYTILDACTGSNGFGSLPGCRSLDRASVAHAKSYAAYGQLTWTPASLEQFHLTVGGRYTHDEKNGLLFKVSNRDTNLTFDLKSNRFDPLVTLAFEATPDINLYAKYATGYRAGGASSRSLTYRAFGPEKVASYELGAKMQFFDRMARLNLAGFMMDRTGSQIDFNQYDPVTNRNTLETINAPGTTKIKGIEADLTVHPTSNFTLGVSYAYTHTKIPPTPNPFIAGNPEQAVFIVYTPRHAASGSIDYSHPIGNGDTSLQFHMDGNYSGRAYSFDNEDVKNEASFLVNARLALTDITMPGTDNSLTLALWARNLFNEEHIYRRSAANSNPSRPTPTTTSITGVLGDYANFNAPRTFGIEATLKF